METSAHRRRVIVTGASRGIGRAIATECARRGAIVGANYFRSFDEARSLARSYPDAIRLLHFDVRDFEAVHAALSEFGDSEGGIDALVNNAGIGAKPQFLVKADGGLLDDIVRTNFLGTIYCTRAALQFMVKARSGHVLNISSIAASEPMEGLNAYAASKSAVEVLASAVAKEYSRRGIRANSLRFGLVRTDMAKDLIRALAIRTGCLEVELAHAPEDIARIAADVLFGTTAAISGSVIDVPDPRCVARSDPAPLAFAHNPGRIE